MGLKIKTLLIVVKEKEKVMEIVVSDTPKIIMLNCDCQTYMAGCLDKQFDLAIVDPPYGIGFAKTHTGKGWTIRESKDWDAQIPPEAFFSQLWRVSINQVIWGGQLFYRPFTAFYGLDNMG